MSTVYLLSAISIAETESWRSRKAKPIYLRNSKIAREVIMLNELFRDQNQPAEVRAKDLLQRMTLDEKLAQIGFLWGYKLLEERRVFPGRPESLWKRQR